MQPFDFNQFHRPILVYHLFFYNFLTAGWCYCASLVQRPKRTVWDCTCPADTLAESHLNRAVLSPSAVANDAEDRKSLKYRCLASMYHFVHVAVKTLGSLGEEASAFFCNLGNRIAAVSSEPRSSKFLLQRLSVAMQRGNASRVLGTVPATKKLDNLFY